jgi:hypothetical protein
MAPGKSEYFSDAFFKPFGASGEADRAARKEVGLGNHASALVGVGLVRVRHVNRVKGLLFSQGISGYEPLRRDRRERRRIIAGLSFTAAA